MGSGILEPASAHRRKSSNELLSDGPACDDVLESRVHEQNSLDVLEEFTGAQVISVQITFRNDL